jgi:hypothetical protein
MFGVLAGASGALGAGNAWGQSPTGPAAPTPVPTTPAPVSDSAPTPEPTDATPTPVPSTNVPATQAPTPAERGPAEKPETLSLLPAPLTPPGATPDPTPPEDPTTPGWFRVDSDLAGLSLWVGATHDLGGVGLATDVIVSSGAYSDIASGEVFPFSVAQFDVGPAFAFVDGALALTPMVGIQFDWYQRRTVALPLPQLFTIVNFGPLYFESWVQCFFYGLFSGEAKTRDSLYTRDFILYKLGNAFALGPHVELTYLFDSRRVISLPVGGAAMLNYGKNSTLLLAIGYETDADARFTFIQTW